jgi:hypothetical protein
MDPHDTNERFRLLTHRLYTQRIDEDPTLIDAATAFIRQVTEQGPATLCERMWFALLSMPASTIKTAMLDDGPEGRLLRANSPFSVLIGVTNLEERQALWAQAQSSS